MRIITGLIMKGPQIGEAMMKIEVSHLGVPQRDIIGDRPSFGLFYLLRPVKMGIGDVYLPTRLEIGEGKINYFLKRWKILNGGGENNAVEQAVGQYARTDVPMNKDQVGVIVEYPGSLLQFREIDIDPCHLRTGYI